MEHHLEVLNIISGVSELTHVQEEAVSNSIGEGTSDVKEYHSYNFLPPPSVFDVMDEIEKGVGCHVPWETTKTVGQQEGVAGSEIDHNICDNSDD